jgi:hypothetical protein
MQSIIQEKKRSDSVGNNLNVLEETDNRIPGSNWVKCSIVLWGVARTSGGVGGFLIIGTIEKLG